MDQSVTVSNIFRAATETAPTFWATDIVFQAFDAADVASLSTPPPAKILIQNEGS
jgi:hypothetical protein